MFHFGQINKKVGKWPTLRPMLVNLLVTRTTIWAKEYNSGEVPRESPSYARSRDTGTAATSLASCAHSRQFQTVYIDARCTHRTVSDVPCRYNPCRRRQSNTNRAALGGYCIVSDTQMLQRTRRTGFLRRWPTRLERSSTCTSWYY